MVKILFFFVLTAIAGCNEKAEPLSSNETHKECTEPTKVFIYQKSQEIISEKINKKIWNLSEIDSADIQILRGHFSKTEEIEYLAVCGGKAGLSSGDADNLILKISCNKNNNQFSVDWVSQGSKIKQEDIKDLDKDGLDEIIQTNSYTWMGECGETIHIFNLKNNRLNTLYKSTARSVIDCGGSFAGYSQVRDTLATEVKIELKDTNNDGIFELIENKKFLIHNGGTTEEEIIAGLISKEKVNLLDLKNGHYSSSVKLAEPLLEKSDFDFLSDCSSLEIWTGGIQGIEKSDSSHPYPMGRCITNKHYELILFPTGEFEHSDFVSLIKKNKFSALQNAAMYAFEIPMKESEEQENEFDTFEYVFPSIVKVFKKFTDGWYLINSEKINSEEELGRLKLNTIYKENK